MELVSGSHIPDGLLAAMTLLSEKPRQGVPSWNPAPIQGITEANCTVAIGLRFRCSEIVSGTVDAPSNFQRMPLPGNHLNCTTSTGASFPAPPGFSVSNIAANGAANGLSGAGAAVGQGGYYDFQRFQVGSVTQFFKGYTPVANVAVGAYVQGTGAPQWVASLISNTYAFFNSNNGATAQQAQFRNLGFSLAAGKGSYSCQPSVP